MGEIIRTNQSGQKLFQIRKQTGTAGRYPGIKGNYSDGRRRRICGDYGEIRLWQDNFD